jgi:hypothetical protein
VAVTLLDATNGTVAAGSTTATGKGDWQISLEYLKPGAAMHLACDSGFANHIQAAAIGMWWHAGSRLRFA